MAGWLGRLSWALDTASNFRMQYLVCSAACVFVLLVARGWWWLLVAGAALAVSAAEIVPLYLSAEPSPAASSSAPQAAGFTLLSANVYNYNDDPQPLLDLIGKRDPDVIVIVEATSEWVAALEAIEDVYPYSERFTRQDPFGIALYSRVPFDEVRVVFFGRAEVPSIVARITLGDAPVTIVATHPLAPFRPDLWRLRNEQLGAIADARETFGARFIVAGDFNASPFSPCMKRFVARMKGRYASRGYGFKPTWPTFRRVLLTPLDHILVSEGLVVTDFRTGPHIGSDHLPVQATIALSE